MAHSRVAKITEVIGYSTEGFEEAVRQALRRANRSLAGIRGLEILAKRAIVEDGKIVNFEVRMNLLFEIAPDLDMHE